MSAEISADDLTLLGESFAAALVDASDADAALVDLGWRDVLAAAGRAGFAPSFEALGATGATAGILDDVAAHALGLQMASGTCVVHPAPHRCEAPAFVDGDVVVIDGLVSRRFTPGRTLAVPLDGGGVVLVPALDLDASGPAIDPGGSFRRIEAELPVDRGTRVDCGDHCEAIADAQVALAHELLAAARWMLTTARDHAVERSQFGRPVASFQAVRHKLAESLAAIEGAVSVAGATTENDDPLLAAVAKSLAGEAALLTARNAQQVLGGIGFTDDHPFHRRYKRVLVLDTLYGSASSLPADIGTALLDRGTAPRLVDL